MLCANFVGHAGKGDGGIVVLYGYRCASPELGCHKRWLPFRFVLSTVVRSLFGPWVGIFALGFQPLQ